MSLSKHTDAQLRQIVSDQAADRSGLRESNQPSEAMHELNRRQAEAEFTAQERRIIRRHIGLLPEEPDDEQK